MDSILERIGEIGIVPVVKLDRSADALPLGKALLEAGLPIAEVTFRTDAAEESIRSLSAELPEMLVGAGTVLTRDQVRRAVDSGAKFIVTPGFNPAIVDCCMECGVPVTPGINSPSQIEMALERGITVVKFFPAEQSGGVAMLRAMSAPYAGVRFIPTGGVDLTNMVSYLSFSKVHAVGGSWMVKPELIAAGRFDEITRIARESVFAMHGFELAHIGVNCADETEAMKDAAIIGRLFGMQTKEGASSTFAGKGFEFMKRPYLGEKGHIALACNDVARAAAFLKWKGIASLPETEKKKDGRIVALYLNLHIGGFIVHLLQK